jgi:hypothetical protein
MIGYIRLKNGKRASMRDISVIKLCILSTSLSLQNFFTREFIFNRTVKQLQGKAFLCFPKIEIFFYFFTYIKKKVV